MKLNVTDLSGLDFLTEADAATYSRVSLSHFRKNLPALNLKAKRFLGRKLYRKSDLKKKIEEAPEWQQSIKEMEDTTSIGLNQVNNSVAHLVPYPEDKPKKSERSKKQS
jgi:hypothetical protein